MRSWWIGGVPTNQLTALVLGKGKTYKYLPNPTMAYASG